MILVRVELHSAVTGKVTELARAEIVNDGTGSESVGHYVATVMRGRSRNQLVRRHVLRSVAVRNWPRQRLHVWNLVAEALKAMGYGRGKP